MNLQWPFRSVDIIVENIKYNMRLNFIAPQVAKIETINQKNN